MTKTAGCAAKIGPGVLAQVLGTLPKFEDENLLVGIETSDDAAIYKLNEEQAMIQTVDFFTPMVDDPYLFGQVAATNALSDVYAMGGDPKVALNIVAFPNDLDPEILGEILRGGADKVKEAGLTPLETPSGLMSFEEARMIIECKKMFIQELDYANLAEPYKSKIMEEAYKNEPSKHQMFISEIVNIWIKK